MLSLRWDDVYDFKQKRVRGDISVTEKKTGKPKNIALNAAIINALELLSKGRALKNRFIMENERTKKAISRVQAYRLIREAAEALGFKTRVSCHSLRKTFGYHAWKDNVSPAIIMEIFNHSSLEMTRRYLGVTQDEINEAYTKINFFRKL